MDPWLAALGFGMQAIGSMNQTQDQIWQLGEEAQVSEMNAKMAREAGAYNAMRQELETNQVLGRMTADYGASGISLESGNVLDSLRQSAINAEMDRQSILRGSELQARQQEYRASMARIGQKNAKTAGLFNLLGTGVKGFDALSRGVSESKAGSGGGGYTSTGSKEMGGSRLRISSDVGG